LAAVVVPVGVTGETVESVLRGLPTPDSIFVVTVPGFEDVKRRIIGVLRSAAEALGSRFYEFTVEPGGVDGLVSLYRALLRERPGVVYLVGLTGSRYLFPLLAAVLLQYWRVSGARVLLVHGVEGGGRSLEPLPGFFAPAMRLSAVQRRLLAIVYGSAGRVSGKDLIERYGFTRSVYYVLADLERKGLLVVRRNRIEKTLPGMLVYRLLEASGEAGDGWREGGEGLPEG